MRRDKEDSESEKEETTNKQRITIEPPFRLTQVVRVGRPRGFEAPRRLLQRHHVRVCAPQPRKHERGTAKLLREGVESLDSLVAPSANPLSSTPRKHRKAGMCKETDTERQKDRDKQTTAAQMENIKHEG